MFYFSLPILFNDIRLITPGESFLMMMSVAFLLYFTAPLPATGSRLKTDENYLLNAWLGNISLSGVFWPFFLLFNCAVLIADWLAKAGKLTVSSWDDIYFVMVFPALWWLTSVWRCSGHASLKLWAGMARLATLAIPVEYALKLSIRIYYPRLFFNCEDLLMNYGNCF